MSEGRVVVVTGAARGIGRATAVAFARAGYRVAGADIAALASPAMDYEPATPEDLAQTGKLVGDEGGEWLPVVFDQRDIAAVREGFAQVVERFGGVDVVFANAGIQGFAPLLEMSDELWRDQIDINLTGTANVVRVGADYKVILASRLLNGLGFGLCYPTLNIQALTGVRDEEQGLASGLVGSSFQIGGAIVLAVATATILAHTPASATPVQSVHAFTAGVYVAVASASLLMAIAVAGWRDDRRRHAHASRCVAAVTDTSAAAPQPLERAA